MSDYIGTNEQLCSALNTLSGKAKMSQQDAAVAWGAAERIAELEAENDNRRAQIAALQAQLDHCLAERRSIVSHATMGQTDGDGMSLNAVSVAITALRHELYRDAQAQLAEALECVEAMNHTTIIGHAVQDGAIDDEYCDEFRDIHTSMIKTVLKARAIRAMKENGNE